MKRRYFHGFTQKHYDLAAEYGLNSDRILIFDSLAELGTKARELGIPLKTVTDYTEKNVGVMVQADGQLGGSDWYVLLQTAVPLDVFGDTYRIVYSIDPDATLAIANQLKPGVIYAFILLHEIAHHELRHDDTKPHAIKEDEAHQWAWVRLRDRWEDYY